MSAKFPRGGGGAGPFLARSLHVMICNGMYSTTSCKHNLNICNNCYYCIKPVSHPFNSHLSGTNPCIQPRGGGGVL